jgi:hypothetical protein
MKLFARASAAKAGRRKGRAVGLALTAGLLLPMGTIAAGVFSANPASASITHYAANGSTYHAVQPYRLADTRQNSGQTGAGQTLTAGRTLTVGVSPSGVAPNNVPFGATAVVVNITAVDPSSTGYLTAFAAGQTVPNISTVNFTAGQTVANEATIALGNTGDPFYGQLSVYNFTGSTDVVIDVQGYYTPHGFHYPGPYTSLGGGYNAVTDVHTGTNHPVRVLDTRPGSGQQGAGETLGPDSSLSFYPGTGTFPYGTPAVPGDATAVVLNVTAATSTADSFLTAWATGGSQPLASNLNFTAGDVVPNRVIVPINPVTKQVSIYNAAGNTDVVVDLDGYYSPYHSGSLYYPLVTPTRIVDTRPGSGAPYSGQTLGTGTILTTNVPADTFPPVTGYTAPSDFTGVDINTTVTDTDADGGYLTQYPSNAGSTPPLASDLNWNAGDIVSNADQLSSGGTPNVAIDNFNFTGDADLVIDLYGYFGSQVLQGDNG